MQQQSRTEWKLQYGRSRARKGKLRILKKIFYILFMGFLWQFVASIVSSYAIQLGLSPDAEYWKYPFFVGLALGLGSWLARPPIKDICEGLLIIPVSPLVFGSIGIVVGGVLVLFGLSWDNADWIPRIAFALGLLIVPVGLFAAAAWYAIHSLRHRNRPHPSQSSMR
jgi:hypothetical protein